MRITKQMAFNIANRIVDEKFNLKTKEALNNLENYIEEQFFNKIPKPVLALQQEYPNYICGSYGMTFSFKRNSNGYNESHAVGFKNKIPLYMNSPYMYKDDIVNYLGQNIYNKMNELYNIYKDIIMEKYSMRNKLQSSFESLKTTQKVKEFLPEAFPYFPNESNKETMLQPNFNELKNFLNG